MSVCLGSRKGITLSGRGYTDRSMAQLTQLHGFYTEREEEWAGSGRGYEGVWGGVDRRCEMKCKLL